MMRPLPWLLWLALCLVIVAAYTWVPPIKGFIGLSDRIFYFHVPMAVTSFVAFITAAVYSLRYLVKGRRLADDHAAATAVEIGLVFCLLATVTGAMWARTMWGAYWNWDPRQTSITFALLFYAAYITLRGAILDGETRRRLAAAYATLGLVVAPFLFFVAPRVVESLHPQPLINAQGKLDIDRPMLSVFLGSMVCFILFFFWVHTLARRVRALEESALARHAEV